RLAEAMVSFGSDFIPGYGDAKSFVEAQDPFDYTMAGIGLVPGHWGCRREDPGQGEGTLQGR
ncbi:hypothetical protein D0N87_24605, partial [Pseudomonas sp. ATCC 13867]